LSFDGKILTVQIDTEGFERNDLDAAVIDELAELARSCTETRNSTSFCSAARAMYSLKEAKPTLSRSDFQRRPQPLSAGRSRPSGIKTSFPPRLFPAGRIERLAA